MERRGALGVEPYRAERRASCTSNRASAATSTYEHAVSSRGASLCSACSVARATLTVTSCQLLLQPSTSRRRGSAATSRRASGSCGFCGWRPSQIARPRFPTGTSAPTPCILDAFRPSRSCASSRVRWCAARVAPSAARAFPLAAMSCASRGWIALISSVPSSLRRPCSRQLDVESSSGSAAVETCASAREKQEAGTRRRQGASTPAGSASGVTLRSSSRGCSDCLACREGARGSASKSEEAAAACTDLTSARSRPQRDSSNSTDARASLSSAREREREPWTRQEGKLWDPR